MGAPKAMPGKTVPSSSATSAGPCDPMRGSTTASAGTGIGRRPAGGDRCGVVWRELGRASCAVVRGAAMARPPLRPLGPMCDPVGGQPRPHGTASALGRCPVSPTLPEPTGTAYAAAPTGPCWRSSSPCTTRRPTWPAAWSGSASIYAASPSPPDHHRRQREHRRDRTRGSPAQQRARRRPRGAPAREGPGPGAQAGLVAVGLPVLVYMDVDLWTDLNALLPLVAPLLTGHSDVAIGSRLSRGSRTLREAVGVRAALTDTPGRHLRLERSGGRRQGGGSAKRSTKEKHLCSP